MTYIFGFTYVDVPRVSFRSAKTDAEAVSLYLDKNFDQSDGSRRLYHISNHIKKKLGCIFKKYV